jgi:hypothetical protein
MHPAVTARVFLFKENLDSAGPELAGGSINVVYKKADNWSGGEVAVHLAVGSKDLHFAAIRQLEDLNPGRSRFVWRPRTSSKKSAVDLKFSVRVPTQASLMISTSTGVRVNHLLCQLSFRRVDKCVVPSGYL